MASLSVAVTTHNRWDLCRDAISSINRLDWFELQVILVDDASTEEVPRQVADEVLSKSGTLIRHSKNEGLSAARNTAIFSSTNQYFSFCDDDDRWSPGLGSRLVSAMDSAPSDVGMAIAINENRKVSCGHLFDDYPRLTELMKAGLTPPVGSQIYRTELLRQVGGYRSEVLSGVDHDLWISLARINPRVAVAWGEPAIVGSSPVRERLTTVEHRRRAGIEKSLAIWREDFCEVFGEPFYQHFVVSYRWYLDYNFFVKSIQKREYLDAGRRAMRAPWLPIEVVKRRWDRIRGRSRCTLFPEFKGM